MSVVVITGSASLIGAEACRLFAQQGFDVVGIDNDMRSFRPQAELAVSERQLSRRSAITIRAVPRAAD